MELFELVVTAPTWTQRDNWSRIVSGVLVDLVGGVSIYEGQGGWKLGTGELVFEPHFKVQAFCDGMRAVEVFNFLAGTLANYKENCQQETILVILNGEPRFFDEVPEALPL